MSDPRKPFIDKALRATYPPGSIFKFATAFAALEDGQARRGRERCSAPASTSSPARTFHCHGTHGKINLLGAIQHSCDVYFWKLAERIGIDRIADVAREYGFGAPTNLGLNGDSAGRIPTKAWYEQTRPLQGRLRDERGDRAGRRRGHGAADGDGVRGARERRHAVRAAGRRARRGERRPR